MRLIYADALEKQVIECDLEKPEKITFRWMISQQPTIDAVPVVRCEQVKTEILSRMDEFIAEYRRISESTVDHFGGKAEAMDVARRLVNAALTDLCSYGERKVTEDEG